MPLALQKGNVVEITKADAKLTRFKVGLGWDAAVVGQQYDLDVSVAVLKGDKIANNNQIAFFNNKKTADGSVEHSGDNRTGAGDGDDETVKVDLTKVDGDRVDVILTLYEAGKRGQDMSKIANAYIRLIDDVGAEGELARFAITGNDLKGASVLFASFIKDTAGNWTFKAEAKALAGEVTEVFASLGWQ